MIPGIYVIRGKYVDGFGYLTSYLLVDNEDALIIDPGTAGEPGSAIEKTMDWLGLKPKKHLIGILCTHGHPDHIGGVNRLRRNTDAPVMIHSGDAEIMRDPSLFVKERLHIGLAGRLAMKLESGPLKVNYKGMEPDKLLEEGDEIKFGKRKLRVLHTAGHSKGHCAFLEQEKKAIFSGDEINNYPNDPRKFYVDLSGSLTSKTSAINRFVALKLQYIFPSHDVPHILHNVSLQLEEVRSGVLHFQDTVLSHLKARDDADIDQLILDITESRSIPMPDGLESLLPTTVKVALRNLDQAGLVKRDEDGVWRAST